MITESDADRHVHYLNATYNRAVQILHDVMLSVVVVEVAHMIRMNQFTNDSRSPFRVFATAEQLSPKQQFEALTA